MNFEIAEAIEDTERQPRIVGRKGRLEVRLVQSHGQRRAVKCVSHMRIDQERNHGQRQNAAAQDKTSSVNCRSDGLRTNQYHVTTASSTTKLGIVEVRACAGWLAGLPELPGCLAESEFAIDTQY